jgi:hypothetical protein
MGLFLAAFFAPESQPSSILPPVGEAERTELCMGEKQAQK